MVAKEVHGNVRAVQPIDLAIIRKMEMVLPEFAWLGEKTPGLARASCSTKEHIRVIDGSVPVEKASNYHADPCLAEMAEIEVAQIALCFAASPGLAKSGREAMVIDVHPSKFRKNHEDLHSVIYRRTWRLQETNCRSRPKIDPVDRRSYNLAMSGLKSQWEFRDETGTHLSTLRWFGIQVQESIPHSGYRY